MSLSRSRWVRSFVPFLLSIITAFAPRILLASWQPDPEETQQKRRLEMVATQIEARGVKDKAVLAALRKIPRHRFVPPLWRGRAYADEPLPIEADLPNGIRLRIPTANTRLACRLVRSIARAKIDSGGSR